MSTLTKVLIVVLALSTFALCAMVSVYIASSHNYKGLYTTAQNEVRNAKAEQAKTIQDCNERVTKADQRSDQLTKQLSEAQNQLQSLQVKITDLEREKAQLVQEVNGWVSTVEGFTRTKEQQAKLLDEKLAENARIEADLIKLRKELDEVSASLLQERAAADDLKKENRLLAETKAELQQRLDQRLAAYGKETAVAPTVTPRKEAVRMTPAVTREIGLRGLITQINMADKLACISLGKADGVRAGMKFYATRGEQFICEILITDVDAEQSVGIISRLLDQPPQVGDNVSTNL